MFKNWKTSLAGLGTVITGVIAIVNGDMATGVASIVAGLGLIFAKDSNVTGA